MAAINAFISHSFNEKDNEVVHVFLEFFNSLKGTIDFDWDHAEKAELKALSDKVREKIEGKNLFIGILTKSIFKVAPNELKRLLGRFYGQSGAFEFGASEWIVQESGYGLAKCGKLLFLIEDGVRFSAGLHGDLEYVPFTRNNPELCFKKIICESSTAAGPLERREAIQIP